MKTQTAVKLFRMSHQMVEADLNIVEEKYHLDLSRANIEEKDEQWYPQFDEPVRKEAKSMKEYYELLYCLENSIRNLIISKMRDVHGGEWWKNKVSEPVRKTADDSMRKEQDAGVTQRSTDEIDYVNLGELKIIIDGNWDTFSDIFNNRKAFNRIMTSLNVLRAPIAHCSPLASDEVIRLKLILKDWFRLME